MSAGTRFAVQCLAAWAACWSAATACFALARHLQTTTPKGDRHA